MSTMAQVDWQRATTKQDCQPFEQLERRRHPRKNLTDPQARDHFTISRRSVLTYRPRALLLQTVPTTYGGEVPDDCSRTFVL